MRACKVGGRCVSFSWPACLAMAVEATACFGLGCAWADGKTILFASLVGGEDEHPFHVPSHGHEVPLAPDVIDSTQHELSEAHDRFDDAKHRLWNLLA